MIPDDDKRVNDSSVLAAGSTCTSTMDHGDTLATETTENASATKTTEST